MNKIKSHRIIGVDPGTNFLGYAVLEIIDNHLQVLEIGVLNMVHRENQADKLKDIFEKVQQVIKRFKPQELAIEAPFFGKNVQSMLKLGRAQGVAMAAAITKGVTVTEYSPKKIKLSVTGNGNAAKEQVAAMLSHILKFSLKEFPLDATDALAAALCHHYQSKGLKKGQKKYSGWSSFVKDNPNRKIS